MNTTSMKHRRAYSYQRFSSSRQKDGDSLRRQEQAALNFSKQYNLLLTDTFRDEGVSGFKGKNFSHESALGSFLKLVDTGAIEKGSVLIVENMDRLSRQSILPCLSKFIDIINKDIGIGVVSHNKIFDKISITNNPMELMLVLVEFSRAGSESQAKSTRSKSNIAAKIERIKNGEKVSMGIGKPYWITALKNNLWLLDNNKAELVKTIFMKYLAGRSASRIASDFNEDGTPTLRGIKGFVWSTMAILQILKNKNVIGTLTINGQEFDNYFPEIIKPKVFQLIQQKLSFNKQNRGGSKNGMVNNLFKGLLVCADCGKNMEVKIAWYTDVKGVEKRYFTYTCSGVHVHTKCPNKGRLLVRDFETNFFDFIFMAKAINFQTIKQANTKLVALENELVKLDMRINRIVKLFSTNDELSGIDELSKELLSLKSEREAVKILIFNEKVGAVAKTEAPKVVKSLLELKQKEELGQTITELAEREKARNLMPQLYKRITLKFNSDSTHAEFFGVDGSKDTMTINKQKPKTEKVEEENVIASVTRISL